MNASWQRAIISLGDFVGEPSRLASRTRRVRATELRSELAEALGAAQNPAGDGVGSLEEYAIAFDEKPHVDQRRQQRLADELIEVPEPLRLAARQTQPGHLAEFALDAPQHVIHPRSSDRRVLGEVLHTATIRAADDGGV